MYYWLASRPTYPIYPRTSSTLCTQTKAELLQVGIFFSSSIYLHEKFYYQKSWKSKKLRPPSISLGYKTDVIKIDLD